MPSITVTHQSLVQNWATPARIVNPRTLVLGSFNPYFENGQVVDYFYGRSCLNIDVFDINGNRHTPREWFIAPLHVIEQAIHYIIAGAIVKYRYDDVTEEIVER